MIRTFSLGLAAGAALLASPAAAQEAERPLILSVGGGAQLLPEYPGGEEYEFSPLITGFARREGDPIPLRTPDDGFGFALIRGGAFEFGPLVQFQPERDAEDVGLPVDDVDFTVEAGAFVNINISPNFRLRLEGQKGIGGHEGLVGTVAADFVVRPNIDTLFTIGPRLRFNDNDYADAYFGVPPRAIASDVPPYDPDGGLRAVGAVAGITHQITRQFGVYGYAGYDRLIGDAADSPIVRFGGSENQFSAGVALFFSFSLGNLF